MLENQGSGSKESQQESGVQRVEKNPEQTHRGPQIVLPPFESRSSREKEQVPEPEPADLSNERLNQIGSLFLKSGTQYKANEEAVQREPPEDGVQRESSRTVQHEEDDIHERSRRARAEEESSDTVEDAVPHETARSEHQEENAERGASAQHANEERSENPEDGVQHESVQVCIVQHESTTPDSSNSPRARDTQTTPQAEQRLDPDTASHEQWGWGRAALCGAAVVGVAVAAVCAISYLGEAKLMAQAQGLLGRWRPTAGKRSPVTTSVEKSRKSEIRPKTPARETSLASTILEKSWSEH